MTVDLKCSFTLQQEEKKKELTLDLEDKDRRMKRRYLGTIRFIGELFMMSMLTSRIMHDCVERLLSGYKKTKAEDKLECLCELLTTIGARMDEPQALAGGTRSSSTYPDHHVSLFKKNALNDCCLIVDLVFGRFRRRWRAISWTCSR